MLGVLGSVASSGKIEKFYLINPTEQIQEFYFKKNVPDGRHIVATTTMLENQFVINCEGGYGDRYPVEVSITSNKRVDFSSFKKMILKMSVQEYSFQYDDKTTFNLNVYTCNNDKVIIHDYFDFDCFSKTFEYDISDYGSCEVEFYIHTKGGGKIKARIYEMYLV